MVGVTKIQRGNANYWIGAVAEGGDDYYTKPGEAPGEWVGELAVELELSGEVQRDAYVAILEGRDPNDGEVLLQRPPTRVYERADGRQRRAEPVLGYDVRFSAPKSISLVYALGDAETRERVLKVVDHAVRDALDYLESEACLVQRGRGGEQTERGRGFVGMAFRHRMSRAGDPALHVHVVLSNLTRAQSDGRWLTLANPKGESPLWTFSKATGYVFQASLRAEMLREFGLEHGAVRNGYADLVGIDRRVIDGFSSRSREIRDAMNALGTSGARAAEIAAYKTREAKDYGVDADAKIAEWVVEAEGYGLTPDDIRQMVSAGVRREPTAIAAAQVDAALAQLETTTAHFDRRQLLCALANQLREGTDADSLGRTVDRILGSERVVPIHEANGALDRAYYTTPRLAALEQRFVQRARKGTDASAGVVDAGIVTRVLSRHAYLGADQRQMVERLTSGGERVVPIAAWPGTGKTTALAAAREAWEAAGLPVLGVATARTASAELSDAGVPATSIAALLHRTERWQAEGVGLTAGTIIVVDEANMTSTPHLEALGALIEDCDGKLVLIGDPRQIGAVGPGGLYGHLTRAIEPTTLSEIRRQPREFDRRVVELVVEGKGSDALDLLRAENRLIVGDTLEDALRGMLVDWHRDYSGGADAVMIARRNRDVDALNAHARQLLVAEGTIGPDAVLVGERPFAAGDRVQTRVNTDAISNRERWDVVSADAAAQTLDLQRVGGDQRRVTAGPEYLQQRTLDGEPALDYAYAVTKYGAESKTFDRAYPLLDAGESSNEALVALSRGREIPAAYVVAAGELLDADLGPARRQLEDELHDVRRAIERDRSDYPALEVSARRRIEALGEQELTARWRELRSLRQSGEPGRERRQMLDRQIDRAQQTLEALIAERRTIQGLRRPDARELAQAQSAEASAAQALERLERDRSETGPGRASVTVSAEQRLELCLIEERMGDLRRRHIAAERMEPSPFVYEALGPRPKDDVRKAVAWNQGVEAIYSYRQRHGLQDRRSALGAKPHEPSARAERARAQLALQRAQRQLAWSPERSAERSIGIERGIGVGR